MLTRKLSMFIRIASLIMLLLPFSMVQAENKKKESEYIYIYLGGFLGPSYHVNIKNNRLLYRSGVSSQQEKIDWVEMKFTTQDRSQFIDKLKKLGVLNWKKEYINDKATDGTQWRVVIKTQGIDFSAFGSNDFPKEFNQFKEYISKDLLKGKKFE